MSKLVNPEIITTESRLGEVCAKLAEAGSFAFDTEFVGEDNYEAEVCVVQVTTDSFCAVIDALAGLDLTGIWDLVADEDVEVIVHAGGEDLTQCFRRAGKPPKNVFDTQVAAGLVGFGYPTSLTRLARVTIGAKIHKSQTLTDWRQRPLSREQTDYAAEDVLYLPAMYRDIGARLNRLGREAWAKEECARMCQSATTLAKGEQKLRRLRGAGSMSRKELAIADALLDERDRLASEYNRPPRTVLRDHLLVEMAKQGWTDVERIRSLRGLSLKVRAVERLAGAIEAAKRLPKEQWPELQRDEDNKQEEVLLALVSAVLRDYCLHNELAYSLLASKQDLRAFVRTHTRSEQPAGPILLKSGWRGTVASDLLDRLLSGKSSVRVVRKGDERRLETA